MRILQAHKYFWYKDGASNAFLSLSQALEERDHDVIPFSMHHANALPSAYDNYFVSEMDVGQPGALSFLDKIRFAGRMFYSVEAKKQMQHLLDAEHIDIAHLHNIYHHISPSILPVLKKRGIPIVMTLHDYHQLSPNYALYHHGAVHEEDAHGWYLSCIGDKCVKDSRLYSMVNVLEMIFHHKIMRYYERYVDRFIAPSKFMRELCIRHGVDADKIVHIPSALPAAPVFPVPKSGAGVLYAGRLSEEKGLDVLLDAAIKTPDIPYRIAGTGPLEQHLRQRTKDEDIKNVSFLGFVEQKKLQTMYADARIVVLPAVWYENYPLSVLEAKAAGSIVVGSDIGGISEMLPKDMLVSPGDAGALAKMITYWYEVPLAKRKTAGRVLQKDIQTHNMPDQYTQHILDLYDTLVD